MNPPLSSDGCREDSGGEVFGAAPVTSRSSLSQQGTVSLAPFGLSAANTSVERNSNTLDVPRNLIPTFQLSFRWEQSLKRRAERRLCLHVAPLKEEASRGREDGGQQSSHSNK